MMVTVKLDLGSDVPKRQCGLKLQPWWPERELGIGHVVELVLPRWVVWWWYEFKRPFGLTGEVGSSQ
jgi:hypothetical protein